ncbi:nucleotide-diphospho-sugar transferase [Abortiporus biennis]|nr:nucleotide-diphospho-sugar transferase [Abortiporus biennis]
MLHLTSDHFPFFVPLGIIGFFRYTWYLIRVAAWAVYRPIPLPANPTYTPVEDVTIVVPTIDAGQEFKEAARSWLAGNPKEILIITEQRMLEPLQELANSVDSKRIRVLTVPYANKRLQMTHGIKHTTTDIIVFADDDAIWPPTLLPYVLACFEDQQVGGVGTSQRVQAVGKRMTVWEVLAAFRLSIRNIEIAASTHIDGGIPCLSGRTAAYRTVILKDPLFLHGFTHDYWLGKYQLNSGDDKFLTRWMVSHGWNTYVQCCKEAELLSTMRPNWRFLKQVLRWTRNTWRSDMRSLFVERFIWSRHPYVAYTMVDKLINPFTLLLGPVFVAWIVYKTTIPLDDGGYHLPWWNVVVSYAIWLLVTRTAKLLPHFWNRPQDVVYIPAFILFGYYFAIMKIYALLTLHETGWGTRAGVGDPTTATAAVDEKEKAPDVIVTRPSTSSEPRPPSVVVRKPVRGSQLSPEPPLPPIPSPTNSRNVSRAAAKTSSSRNHGSRGPYGHTSPTTHRASYLPSNPTPLREAYASPPAPQGPHGFPVEKQLPPGPPSLARAPSNGAPPRPPRNSLRDSSSTTLATLGTSRSSDTPSISPHPEPSIDVPYATPIPHVSQRPYIPRTPSSDAHQPPFQHVPRKPVPIPTQEERRFWYAN